MNQNELYHHGIKGQKRGVRRYQYADGSLTPAGKKRYQNFSRSLGGTKFAKNAIKNSRYLDSNGKRQALDEQAYLAAKKKSNKTRGQITYDVATGKYSVDKTGTRKEAVKKNTLKAAGIMAGISAVQTFHNYKDAQAALDLMGYGDKILVSEIVTKGTVAAGKAAIIGAVAYVGAKKASDYVKERRIDNNKN